MDFNKKQIKRIRESEFLPDSEKDYLIEELEKAREIAKKKKKELKDVFDQTPQEVIENHFIKILCSV